MENKVNNYEFARMLDRYKREELDPLDTEVDKAYKIISDLDYKWKDDEQRRFANIKFDKMSARNAFLQKFYKEGMNITLQHESLVNNLCKWYEVWRNDVSNEGRQETEMMTMQADILHGIFTEIWEVLKPLELDIKPPNGLNL